MTLTESTEITKLRRLSINSYAEWIKLARQLRNNREEATYCLSRAYTCEDGFAYYLEDVLGYSDLAHFHRPIIEQAVDLNVKRRMLQALRGSFKSSISTIGLATWLIGRDMALTGHCNVRILIASEALELAKAFAASVGAIVNDNPHWKELFGEHRGDRTQRRKWLGHEFISMHRKYLYLKEPTVHTGATDAPRTGNHYDLIILDDLETERGSATREQIDKVHTFYKLVIPLLEPKVPHYLRDTPSGIPVLTTPIIQLVSTRWHHDDIYARLEKEIDQLEADGIEHWSRIVLPGENKDGSPAFPERFPEKELQRIKQEMGSYQYSCQILLDPTPESERDFKREWLQYSRPDQYRRPSLRTYIGADFAYTPQTRLDTGEIRKADYTVIVTIMVDEMWNYIIKDIWRKRCTKGEGLKELMRQYTQHKALAVGLQKFDRAQIEEAVTHMEFQEGVSMRKEWISYPSKQSKNDRILTGLQPIMEAKKLFLLPRCEWLEDEFMDFPRAAFDDGLDALCNAVKIAKPMASPSTQPKMSSLLRHIRSLHRRGTHKIGLSGQKYAAPKGGKNWRNM